MCATIEGAGLWISKTPWHDAMGQSPSLPLGRAASGWLGQDLCGTEDFFRTSTGASMCPLQFVEAPKKKERVAMSTPSHSGHHLERTNPHRFLKKLDISQLDVKRDFLSSTTLRFFNPGNRKPRRLPQLHPRRPQSSAATWSAICELSTSVKSFPDCSSGDSSRCASLYSSVILD